MGLPQFEYEHCEQTTSELSSPRRRRYLLMAGIFGVILVISAVIIAVVTLNYQEEEHCMNGQKCMRIKDCDGQFLEDITFPCGDREDQKICCKPKLLTRTEGNIKNTAERAKKIAKLQEDCGIIPLIDKVANGENAVLGQFPWMAILGYNVSIAGEPLLLNCGGTLINDKYILTAAHCVVETIYPLTTVILGIVNLTSVRTNTPDCQGPVCANPIKIAIEKIIPHPNYDKKSVKNDIALLKLESGITEDDEFVRKICLPFEFKVDEYLNNENFSFTISGWGLTKTRGSINSILQYASKIEPWKYDRCNDKITLKRLQPITKKQLCATGQNYTEACYGDSGGPLTYDVVKSNEEYTTQFGVISFKSLATCGTEKQPVVFTRVDAYLDWILDNMDI